MQIKNRYLKLFIDVLHFSKYYRNAKKSLKKLESWKKEDIDSFNFNKLKYILQYAYANVPYYKTAFDNAGFHPNDFKQIEDIKKVPILTKEIIRKNKNELISKSVPKKYLKLCKTGGTTGLPLEFYLDKRTSSPIEFAYIKYIWKKIKFRFYDRCVVLRADLPRKTKGEKCWQYNITNNWLSMSPHYINKDNFRIHYEKIIRFKPKFIIAYPTAISALAKLLKKENLSIPSLKGIICSSETLFNWQRDYLKSVFNVPVFSYYGLTEKCCIAGECLNNEYYKFIPTYGYVELLNNNKEWCSEENESGEIIATGFNNIAFPFIRYKTQDIGIYTNYDDGTPGWKVIKEIKGRKQEYFIDKTGSLITFTGTDEAFWSIIDKINAYQYSQSEPGKVLLKIELFENLTKHEIEKIHQVFHSFYPGFSLEIKFVDNIPRTQSGKFRYLVQNIPIEL